MMPHRFMMTPVRVGIALCMALIGIYAIPTPASAATLLHAGHVIDGVSPAALDAHTLVIDGDKIQRIVPGFLEPDTGDTVIDLKAYTVLPGLMDMHTHLANETSPTSYLESVQLSSAELALNAAKHARTTVMSGFTVVRDLGDAYNVTAALRNAIARGDMIGPRIFTATTALASTGGHGDPTNGLAPSIARVPTPADGVFDSVDEARKAVRQRYKDGADLIKITATGGVLSIAASSKNAQLMEEEIKAIVDTARDYGFHVAAHAHGAEGIKRAVRAGVATIEHGTYLDDEGIRLMKKHGTYLVPTLMAGAWVAEKSKIDNYFPDIVRVKAAEIGPLMQATFTRAYRAGVKIMFGTDSGVSAHGDNAKEFALMVEGGMPAMVALQSATIVPARFLGISDNAGSLEAGKTADIIAVPGDPLTDITAMGKVGFVMLGGRITKHEGRQVWQ